MTFRPFTSVTRWLLVVIGCAVLATAQPMSAAPEDVSAGTAVPATQISESVAADAAVEQRSTRGEITPPSTEGSATAGSAAPGTIIYPKDSAQRPGSALSTREDSGGSGAIAVVALVLAAAGAWVLLQRRRGGPLVSRGPRKLQIEETRPLGNRQYLVVANYEGKKMLLGVTTGQIQLLARLDGEDTHPEETPPDFAKGRS